MVIRNGAYFLMLTGGSLLTANILYAGIRYGFQPMVIPFTAEKMLHFHKGATFYLCMVAGKYIDLVENCLSMDICCSVG